MKCFVILTIIILLSACSKNNNHLLDERMQYWEITLESNVTKGTSRESIKQWALKNSIEFFENPETKSLYANVETIADSGIGFPCSEWNIILEIQLDDNEVSIGHSISSVGTCV
ncbi:hypothetical protein [Thalassotalea mangrovi]|uniref:Uncharacterized protein n=1 Tax=Thalassotalea mangrovi TaxID=2572245 RepID=A0A4U1B640_9GAMM|nr:hypothetical protein [Thalassotalea mangrovi]TKB45972.1 hypothetical protein E8M12_06940 [Thalassotalea mangrovi]